jgi:hypothetical protein
MNSIADAEKIGLFNGRQKVQKSPSAFSSGTGWPSMSKRISFIPPGVHMTRAFSPPPCRAAAFAAPENRSGRTAAERTLKKSAATTSQEENLRDQPFREKPLAGGLDVPGLDFFGGDVIGEYLSAQSMSCIHDALYALATVSERLLLTISRCC